MASRYDVAARARRVGGVNTLVRRGQPSKRRAAISQSRPPRRGWSSKPIGISTATGSPAVPARHSSNVAWRVHSIGPRRPDGASRAVARSQPPAQPSMPWTRDGGIESKAGLSSAANGPSLQWCTGEEGASETVNPILDRTIGESSPESRGGEDFVGTGQLPAPLATTRLEAGGRHERDKASPQVVPRMNAVVSTLRATPSATRAGSARSRSASRSSGCWR